MLLKHLRLPTVLIAVLSTSRVLMAGTPERIPANPQKGFSWAYYLYVPPTVRPPATLLVETNDSALVTDDLTYFETMAQTWATVISFWADDLGVPCMVPAIPRPLTSSGITLNANPQMLDRDLLINNYPGLERLDLQLIAMIDDARDRLAARGLLADRKVFFVGGSSQATFAQRFTILHPDRVKAVSVGGTSFETILPVAEWNGTRLNYPLGIADLQQVTGQPFDLATFRTVPLQYYEGDEDRNFTQLNATDPDVAPLQSLFGGPETFKRMPGMEAVFNSVQATAQFLVFPGLGHAYPGWSYQKAFFERFRSEPFPPLPPKPMLYNLYFPHIASYGQWETEVALTNSTEVSSHGQLQAFKLDGTGPIETIGVTLAPQSRQEWTIGKTFQTAKDIAYLKYVSDSGFVAGYTRFSEPGGRVSLPVSGAMLQGLFPKMEKTGGWTGLAFVNMETVTANVTLTALDDNGNIIGKEQITVNPGAKVIGLVEQMFHFNLAGAKYFSFISDRNVVGFSVSSSADGLALDGIVALGQYAGK